MSAARALGRRIPDDLSLVGIGTTASAAHFGPGVTSLEFSHQKMAAVAARVLLDAIEEKNRASASERVLEVELVVRGSTTRARPGSS
jgi:LacI family transcriptional regulator